MAQISAWEAGSSHYHLLVIKMGCEDMFIWRPWNYDCVLQIIFILEDILFFHLLWFEYKCDPEAHRFGGLGFGKQHFLRGIRGCGLDRGSVSLGVVGLWGFKSQSQTRVSLFLLSGRRHVELIWMWNSQLLLLHHVCLWATRLHTMLIVH